MTSDSSIDGYIRALKEGCRCVEVIHQHHTSTHIIHRWDTLTNKIHQPTWWRRWSFLIKVITWSFKSWLKLGFDQILHCYDIHMFYVMQVQTEKDKQLSYVESIKIDWVCSTNNNKGIRRAFCSVLHWKIQAKTFPRILSMGGLHDFGTWLPILKKTFITNLFFSSYPWLDISGLNGCFLQHLCYMFCHK